LIWGVYFFGKPQFCYANIEAIFLYGSVALGGYIEGSSDIDFIAILGEPLSDSVIQSISIVHQQLENIYPQTDIMGAYFLKSDIGKSQNEISTLLTYYDKKIHTNGYGADINPITRWTIKHYNLQVYGATEAFNYEIGVKLLLTYVIENLNSYWVGWIERLEEQLKITHKIDSPMNTKLLDEVVEWCTLGMLRQLYTLKEHDIKSKVEAGYYGISILPEQWHELIYEAINIKQLLPERYYHSSEKRLSDLIALLRYIWIEANRVYNEKYGPYSNYREGK
jgi:hypothetical protein